MDRTITPKLDITTPGKQLSIAILAWSNLAVAASDDDKHLNSINFCVARRSVEKFLT